MNKIINLFSKLPTFVFIILIPLGIVIFIASIILFFSLLAGVEGFASVVILVIGFLIIRSQNSYKDALVDTNTLGYKFMVAVGISFFALMGATIDQPGNFIYNAPLQYFCPEGSSLNRSTIVSHPLPERTDITQNFACLDSDNSVKYTISPMYVILLRFIEYVLICYFLIWIAQFINWYKVRTHK